METNNNLPKVEETKKRQMGEYKRVPIFDLEDAINVAQIISKMGSGRLDAESLAESMNLSSSTVRHHINSAKHYQIVETDNDIVKITGLGTSIVHPISKEEHTNGKIKAFLSCNLYNRIYDRYKGKDLPPQDILANIFARDEGVSFKSTDRTVSNFLQSGITAGLINEKDGVYHCGESIEKDKGIADETKVIPEGEPKKIPVVEATGLEEKREIAEKPPVEGPRLNKIKITAEPFFELFINPDEKAFDALIQLLPYYKGVYCKKNDDSLERIVS